MLGHRLALLAQANKEAGASCSARVLWPTRPNLTRRSGASKLGKSNWDLFGETEAYVGPDCYVAVSSNRSRTWFVLLLVSLYHKGNGGSFQFPKPEKGTNSKKTRATHLSVAKRMVYTQNDSLVLWKQRLPVRRLFHFDSHPF